jgi:hypothetical protein
MTIRDLVQRTGDLSIATAHGIPHSTARGWLSAAPLAVVSLEVADLTEPELRQEILKLRRCVEKLAALLRLALAWFTHLGVQVLRSACAGRRRQAAAPPRRGSGARVYAVASGPPVSGCVAESVSGLALNAGSISQRVSASAEQRRRLGSLVEEGRQLVARIERGLRAFTLCASREGIHWQFLRFRRIGNATIGLITPVKNPRKR